MKILQWISCNYYQLSSFFSVIQFLGEILTKLLHSTLQRHWSVRPSPGGPRLRPRQRQSQRPRRTHRLQPDLRGSHCWQVSITTTSIWNFYGNLLFNCLDFPFADPTAATLIFMVKKNYSHIIKGLPAPALTTRPTRRTTSVWTTRTAEQDEPEIQYQVP